MKSIRAAAKPVIPPAVFVFLNFAWAVALERFGGETPIWLIASLTGVGCCWLAIALVKNVALIERFPSLMEWFPFLGNDEQRFALASEITKKYVQGHVIKLTDIAVHGVVQDRIFEDCQIYGPCVVAFVGTKKSGGMLVDSSFRSPGELEDMLLYLRPGQNGIVGVIVLKDCIFRRCQFMLIGVTGPHAMLDKIRTTTAIADQDAPSVPPQSRGRPVTPTMKMDKMEMYTEPPPPPPPPPPPSQSPG